MNDVIYYIQNGYHIVFFSIITHYIINDFKLNMYIFLKVFYCIFLILDEYCYKHF